MSDEVKYIVIGPGITDMVSIMEKAAKEAGVSLADLQHVFELSLCQLQKSADQGIICMKDLAKCYNDIKSTYEFDKPKSKYINKPKNNFKNRNFSKRR